MAAQYRDFLAPPGGPLANFSDPPGVPALTAPHSVCWQVFKNPVTLFIGGVTAVLMELAEPRVRHGVWTHSDFATAPKARLQRTGLAAMVTVYAAEPVAMRMIAGIRRRHEAVAGTDETGRAYNANEPELLEWVQATAMYGFVRAYDRYARPLDQAEQGAAYAESIPGARAYGAERPPGTADEMDALLARMLSELTPSPILSDFLSLIGDAPVLPRVARPLQPLLIRAAIDLVPTDIADRADLPTVTITRAERNLIRLAARTGDNLRPEDSPPVEACRRMGVALTALDGPPSV